MSAERETPMDGEEMFKQMMANTQAKALVEAMIDEVEKTSGNEGKIKRIALSPCLAVFQKSAFAMERKGLKVKISPEEKAQLEFMKSACHYMRVLETAIEIFKKQNPKNHGN
jgi:hypothetical protein